MTPLSLSLFCFSAWGWTCQEVQFVQPAPESTAPRNAVPVILTVDPPSSVRLTRAGAEVAVSVEATELPSGTLVRVRPQALLEAGDGYQLEVGSGRRSKVWWFPFRVGEDIDRLPPPALEVERLVALDLGTTPSLRWLGAELSSMPSEPVVVLVYADDVLQQAIRSDLGRPSFGDRCGSAPMLKGREVNLRLDTVDAAGNTRTGPTKLVEVPPLAARIEDVAQ